jgi:hypothetical protein
VEQTAEIVSCLALAIALAACTGLRAWLPLLLAGLLARFGRLELGDSFGFLSSNAALLLFSVATALEIGADKVPAVDHALDGLSTFLRPAAGSLLAASALGVVTEPLTALVLGVAVGAPSSLIPHAAKSMLRAASTTLTCGLANPVLSTVEDLGTVFVFVLAVLLPFLVVTLVAAAGLLMLRRLTRRAARPARAA